MASTATRRSPRTRVRSLASMATSAARAHGDAEVGLGEGGGVVDAVADHRHDARPAPADARRWRPCPRAGPRRTRRRRRCRRTAATDSAARRLSPVTQHRAQPEAAQLGRPLLHSSASRCRPRRRRRGASPSQPTSDRGLPGRLGRRRTAGRRGRRRGRHALVGEEAPAPGDDGVAVDLAGDAESVACCGSRRPSARSWPAAAAPVAIAAAIGCSEACSSEPASRSSSSASVPASRMDGDEAHRAGRHRAGLVEHDRCRRRVSTRAPRVP